MAFTFRLDEATEARIRRLAAASGQTRGAIVRDAIMQYGADERPPGLARPSAYEVVRSFVGVVRSGGANLSESTHAKFRARLARKHRERRAH